MSTCRKSRRTIVWGETEATPSKPGRRIPLDPPERRQVQVGTTGDGAPIVKMRNTYVPHFASCNPENE